MYHNIQGLQTHAEDLKQSPDFRSADYICLTETWADQEFSCFEMMGYDGFHLPRSLAFEDDNSYYSFKGKCSMVVTQRYNLGKFLENMEMLICKLEDLSEKIVVIGDFNQDILKGGCTVFNFMSSKGFRQLVSSPTTEGGTLIDHVYVKGCLDPQVAIIPTYYSYHEALKIVIPND
ncbi:unnamed protein product [Mytilus edulis]|uniref:Endonuclease/exonuclease/phosphatase domain-containing protein n=1 Tax=Mytilus edulis TaxID=6550 RepID=A0A8S3TJ75_MYTED|nr:unnamed protein product [Mytilus edulis]